MDVLIVFKYNFYIMYKVFVVMEMYVFFINLVKVVVCF